MKHLTKYGNPLHSGGPYYTWPSVATIRSQAGLKSGLFVLSLMAQVCVVMMTTQVGWLNIGGSEQRPRYREASAACSRGTL